MDLNQLANLGEFFGGAAVIVTLGYLAIQVRQGNALARDTASHNWTEFNFSLISGLVEDRALAEIWERGDTEFSSLDAVDQRRILMFEWRALEAWHHAFHQRQAGILADHQWNKIVAILSGPIGERQSVRAAWAAFRQSYDEEFRALVDPVLGGA